MATRAWRLPRVNSNTRAINRQPHGLRRLIRRAVPLLRKRATDRLSKMTALNALIVDANAAPLPPSRPPVRPTEDLRRKFVRF